MNRHWPYLSTESRRQSALAGGGDSGARIAAGLASVLAAVFALGTCQQNHNQGDDDMTNDQARDQIPTLTEQLMANGRTTLKNPELLGTFPVRVVTLGVNGDTLFSEVLDGPESLEGAQERAAEAISRAKGETRQKTSTDTAKEPHLLDQQVLEVLRNLREEDPEGYARRVEALRKMGLTHLVPADPEEGRNK